MTDEPQRERLKTLAYAAIELETEFCAPGYGKAALALVEFQKAAAPRVVLALVGELAEAKMQLAALKIVFLQCRLPSRDGRKSGGGWRISGPQSINELAQSLDPEHPRAKPSPDNLARFQSILNTTGEP